MFEKFTSMEADNFRQRYAGTYGFFVRKDQRFLARLDKIFTEEGQQNVEFSDRDSLKYKLKSDTTEEGMGFEFLPPKCAYYNTKDGVPLLVQRIPARQYLRGICDRNTAIQDTAGRSYPVDFKTLITLFEDKATVKDALTQAVKKASNGSDCAGVAISPQFAVNLGTTALKCFNQTIGTAHLVDNVFQVSLSSPDLWTTEIVDAFKRSQLQMVMK